MDPHFNLFLNKYVWKSTVRSKLFLDPVGIVPLITHMMLVNWQGDFTNQKKPQFVVELLKCKKKNGIGKTSPTEPTHLLSHSCSYQHGQTCRDFPLCWYFFPRSGRQTWNAPKVTATNVVMYERVGPEMLAWLSGVTKTKDNFIVFTTNCDFLDLRDEVFWIDKHHMCNLWHNSPPKNFKKMNLSPAFDNHTYFLQTRVWWRSPWQEGLRLSIG